jgi:hypothetical protein
MHAHAPRRRVRRVIPVLWVAALVAICGGGTAAIAAASSHPKHHPHHKAHRSLSLAGTWSGQYSGAFSGTFTLHWTQSGSRLSGSITLSSPGGKYSVSGSLSGSTIKFGAVGAGATYTGSVVGKSMSGSYKSPQGGGAWSAHKTS